MPQFTQIIETLVDIWFSLWPQKSTPEKLKNCKLIAHRGYHHEGVKESTFEAFDICLKHGIWGIEFDIQWTKDLVPIIQHDENCGRIFNRPDLVFSEITFETLRAEVPELPSLKEIIDRYGKKLHLMIELKEPAFIKEGFKNTNAQKEKILIDLLKNLTPQKDYHLMSLNIDVFNELPNIDKKHCLSIALTKVDAIYKNTLQSDLGGFTGHYLLITKKMRDELKSKNKTVGLGFIQSKNSLYRELNLGADWIFTNHPLRVQKYITPFI